MIHTACKIHLNILYFHTHDPSVQAHIFCGKQKAEIISSCINCMKLHNYRNSNSPKVLGQHEECTHLSCTRAPPMFTNPRKSGSKPTVICPNRDTNPDLFNIVQKSLYLPSPRTEEKRKRVAPGCDFVGLILCAQIRKCTKR